MKTNGFWVCGVVSSGLKKGWLTMDIMVDSLLKALDSIFTKKTVEEGGLVLELGIIIHSVIIGLSLGASKSPKTIKPLIVALSFHQFFEGLGLGGCIFQAGIKSMASMLMGVFFALTTPSGIVIGILVSKSYEEKSSTALIVQGVLNAASAGILIYMALVDLLSPDFKDPRMQNNKILLLTCNVSLLLGAALMSLLAKWS